MNKKVFKIIKLYAISLICIACYFLLENTNFLLELIEKFSKLRYSGFPAFFISGLIKYGLLFVGIGIIIILNYLLIKEKIEKQLNS